METLFFIGIIAVTGGGTLLYVANGLIESWAMNKALKQMEKNNPEIQQIYNELHQKYAIYVMA